MQKRREALRIAGWLGVLTGLIGLAVGAIGGSDVARLVGAYGMLLVLSGGWAVIGTELLVRHERRAAAVTRSARAASDQQGALSRSR